MARLALLLLLASLAVCLWPGDAAAEGPASIRVVPYGDRYPYDGGPFDISIWVTGIDHHGTIEYQHPPRSEASVGLGAFEVIVSYDPSIIEATGARSGTFLRSTGRSSQCLGQHREPGVYAVGCISSGSGPGPQAAGQLAELTFRPVAQGTAILTLSAQMSGPLGDDIPVEVNGGFAWIVGGPDPDPTPTPPPGGNNNNNNNGGDDPPVTLEEDGTPSHIPVGFGTLPDYLRFGPTQPGASNADAAQNPSGGPIAGMGYLPPKSTWPFILTGVLAIAGVVLVTGANRARRAKR